MRTPLWETSPGALVALLNSGAPLSLADLYTITLLDGTVYRWSGHDLPHTLDGHTWSLGPGFSRDRLKWTVGVAVDSMSLTITDNLATLINGQGLIAFIRAGGLRGATIQVDRAFWGIDDAGPVGTLLWFIGHVAEITEITRHEAQLNVKSPLEGLDVQVPRDVYQPGCLNTLYGAACGVDRTAFVIAGTVTVASSAARTVFGHGLAQPAGWFNLGVVTMTDGANAGISRTVKQHTSTQIQALQPWPFAVTVGTSFSIVPGCDKTVQTCDAKFSNKPRFRGQPYVPVADTIV